MSSTTPSIVNPNRTAEAAPRPPQAPRASRPWFCLLSYPQGPLPVHWWFWGRLLDGQPVLRPSFGMF